ncbi:addiction module protein [Flavobacterium litorale]|uniref:Addiction module protein n=1 Tax=Flavobacterium litorale TaxID=2856519 RepID=A0ABX8V7D8_9FLAO|nr:addiction module protein [Flavobacterium litorale]
MDNYSNAELEKELDKRLQNLDEGKSELYSWDDLKNLKIKKFFLDQVNAHKS